MPSKSVIPAEGSAQIVAHEYAAWPDVKVEMSHTPCATIAGQITPH